MRKSTIAFAIIGFAAGTLFPGCATTSEQRAANAKQELKDARAEYRAEWQSFKHESEQTIEANEKRMDAFRAKMEMAGADTKARYAADVVVLEQKNRDLRKKLGEYKDEGRSNWEHFKANFAQDVDGIGKTMKDLFNDHE
jgi:hypothetical protein